MKKQRGLMIAYISITAVLLTTVALGMSATLALFEKYANGNGTYGEVSLRSYYESGSGTEDDPFIITRPRHLYNFSRLQGLGVYGEKKYFQLGKVDLGGEDSNGVPMCYADDSSNTKKPYLDMSTSNRDNNPINAIGSEALPFYGEFDGQNVEIKNLNVYASPQDAGLFGYTAHGSIVQNLFLSNVTIHALGYTDEYADLYSPLSTIGDNVSFSYNPNDGNAPTTIDAEYSNTIYSYYYANNLEDFEYTAEGSSPVPAISVSAPSNSYTFSSLLSGDLVALNENNQIVPNLTRLFAFFKEKKTEEGIKYPLQASSTASLIVSSVDGYGQKHSRVLLSIEFDFSLDSATSNFISMGVRVTSEHGNNIGIVAGHCDGTITDCYVYNGSFVMNDGGVGYNKLANGSNLGLIGLVGGTVQNVLASESDVGAKEGKNIGVLDFTTIYNDVITDTSFTPYIKYGNTNYGTYVPNPTTKYMQYLRYNTSSGKYVTYDKDTVSFRGRSVISNTDLGVFTIATDSGTSGYDTEVTDNLNFSMVKKADTAINGDYYIYYSTGEYNKSKGISFSNYVNSYNSDTSSYFNLGYHLPRKDEVSRQSFDVRELRHNYYFRFKLDPSYRSANGFYFSDADMSSDGGSYLANYFNYKLVDKNNVPIPAGNKKCGLMLKDTMRQEISSLTSSFMTANFSHANTVINTVKDADNKDCVHNSVNFEVKTDYANVTVVAGLGKLSTPAVLGVYKLNDNELVPDGNKTKYTRKYNDPDYAFFLPTDDHLAYFDYRVNTQLRKGEIGTYDSQGNFTVADYKTNATVAKAYNTTEYGYQNNKERLYAHTFYLPRGRYYLGAATGAPDDYTGTGMVNIYYMCAQGQDDGQLDFDDNVFFGNDKVENIDFTKRPRFSEADSSELISVVPGVTTYDSGDPNIVNQRCYVALVNSDRSLFNDVASNLSFAYNPTDGKFYITSTLNGQDLIDAFEHVAVNNYPHGLAGPDKVLTVSLFGNESNAITIVYPTGE